VELEKTAISAISNPDPHPLMQAMENVWSAARLQAESLSWVVGLRKYIRPVCGDKLLAIMESAHRWSTKTAELKKFAFPERLEQRRF
jgi:hypothetical protein